MTITVVNATAKVNIKVLPGQWHMEKDRTEQTKVEGGRTGNGHGLRV